jgi:EpsI family protein
MERAWRHYWVAVAVLVLAAPLPSLLGQLKPVPLRRPLSALAYSIGDWHGRDQYLSARVRAMLGTQDLLLREYAAPDRAPVWLYVSYFAEQRQGEISHSPKNCLPGNGWEPEREVTAPYPLPSGGQVDPQINEILYDKEDQRQLVFYWFRERGRIVASEYWVKWYLMWDAVTRHRTDGALVRVSTPVAGSEDAARRRCVAFMQTVLPRLDALFPN